MMQGQLFHSCVTSVIGQDLLWQTSIVYDLEDCMTTKNGRPAFFAN